jgi:hypothetical protein
VCPSKSSGRPCTWTPHAAFGTKRPGVQISPTPTSSDVSDRDGCHPSLAGIVPRQTPVAATPARWLASGRYQSAMTSGYGSQATRADLLIGCIQVVKRPRQLLPGLDDEGDEGEGDRADFPGDLPAALAGERHARRIEPG